MKIIDVSSYQGTVDWKKVIKNGCEGAILKVIRKDLTVDKQFENNWDGCADAGVTVQGVYNYSYATTVSKGKSDAKAVLDILGDDKHPMVWLDWEDDSLPTGSEAIEIINAYGDVITAGGCQFGVYFGMSYYEDNIKSHMSSMTEAYRKGWIARYPSSAAMDFDDDPSSSKKPDFAGTLYGWQYTSLGSIDGIDGNVDFSEWYEDVEAEDVATTTTESTASDAYTYSKFISDSQTIWGKTSAEDMLSKTVKISTTNNTHHKIVTPLERYMSVLGYYSGTIEADNNKTPIYGNGMRKAIILYQTNVVKAAEKYRDGILDAKKATWKKLYNVA